MLLDSRLANIHTRTIQSQFTANFEILAGIPKSAIAISTIDLSNSFFALAIEEDLQHLFSFFDHRKRRLMFRVCPQGFKNSGYFLQQALLKALKGINNVLLLADDITIFSTISEEDNIRTVIKVIQRLHEE